ncbi:MAG TPA: hypothetical protein VII72_16495 [Myxococcota bacterium]
MSARNAEIDERLPWSVRLFASAPVPPVVCSLLFCAAIFLAYHVYCWLTNMAWDERLAEFQLLQVAMIAFTPAATVYALRGAERDLADLAPVLTPQADGAEAGIRSVFRVGRAALAIAGAAGFAISIGFVMSPGSWVGGRPALDHPVFVWAALRSVAMGWLIARTVVIELAVAVGFAKLGRHGVAVDWLDQRPLAPFARKGLRSVLLLLLFSFLFSLFLLEPWGKTVAIPMLVFFPVVCVAALLLPVSGVHQQLAEAKRAELARVDAALRAEAEANLKPGAAPATGARLSNLVAWRGLVQAASTWPFDVGVWLRFAVYVSLGLGSWLGGALVERLIGAALD